MPAIQWWCFAQQEAWSWAWRPIVGVWVVVALLAWSYRRLVFSVARSAEPEPERVRRWRKVSVVAALVLIWAALDWPVGPLGSSYLASVHMAQFLAVGVVSPALLLLALPVETFERLERWPGVLAAVEAVTQPVAAFFIFNVAMTASHWPGVVDALMPTQAGSFLIDVVWFAAGLVFWWPIIAHVPERAGFHPLGKIAYLALNAFLIRPPFAMMLFSEHPIYSIYELAPPVASNALYDQQLAAAIMKLGLAWIMFAAVVVVFQRWRRAEAAHSP